MPYGITGPYYLIAVADYQGSNPDLNPENNYRAKAININAVPVANLEVSEAEVLTEYPACGQPISLRYKVTNIGDAPARANNWVDKVFYSRNTYQNGVQAASTDKSELVLNPGEYYIDTVSFIIPIPQTGNFAVYVRANWGDRFFEMDFENNLAMVPLVVDLNAPGDLVVEDVEHPYSVVAGEQITVSWKVKNNGPNELQGIGCSDVLYLSTDTIFDAYDKLLGNVSYDINIPIYAYETHSMSTSITGVREGEYYIIVITDARNAFHEVNEDNNKGYSAYPLEIEIPELYLDTPTSFALRDLEYKDFKLNIGDNISETVLITIHTADSLVGASNNIYVLHNGIGDNLNFDFSTDGQMRPNSEVFIPRTEAGYYGVSFLGQTPDGDEQDVVVLARIMPFEIHAIEADHGGNTGKVTIKMLGSKFRWDMPVWLYKGHGADSVHSVIMADTVRYVNFNQVFVTFDLTDAEEGLYSIAAENYCAGIARLEHCFTIEAGLPENLSTNLIIPSGLRRNRYCCLTFEYGNIGNTDIVNPRIRLISNGESWIGLRRGELNIHRTELDIPIGTDGEPEGILRPGKRYTVTIYCYTNQDMIFTIDINEDIDVRIRQNQANEGGYEE